MIRVLLVEDNALMRRALARFLGSDPNIQLIGEAASFEEGIALTNTLFPDVVLLDLHLSDEKSTTASRIKSSFVGSRVVAMSFANGAETQIIADGYGAITLVDKMTLASDLIPSIQRCAKNRLVPNASAPSKTPQPTNLT
jgi:DNA-binding NarL/FixJ family response regulator